MKLKKLAGVLVVFVAFGLTGVKAAGIMSIPFVTVETPNYGAPTLGGGEGCFPCYYCPWNENYYKEGAAGGGSTLYTYDEDPFPGVCILPNACIYGTSDCDDEETEEVPEEAQLALSEMIHGTGSSVSNWIDSYGEFYKLTVRGNTVQIAQGCGQVVTWLGLDEQ